jgi:hypothetical protein
MAIGIAINGKKLHEVRMPLEPRCEGVVSFLAFPKTRFRFSLEGSRRAIVQGSIGVARAVPSR